MKLQFTAINRESLVQYIAVMLMAVQFSFDSCVYLSSIAYWIEECGDQNADHYLFIVQAVSSAVQIIASFIIGDIAKWVGSIKWTVLFLIFLSFVGNFLYSCSSKISLGAILGGRILCGAASASGALIFSYITAVETDRAQLFKIVSAFRTSAGFFMALSQLVAIFGSYCDFLIGDFRVSSNNAPTFITSFIMVLVAMGLFFTMKNPPVPKRKNTISFKRALLDFFTARRAQLLGSVIIMWGMFLASFLMSEVVYFMPVFLTQSLGWETKFQGVAFMVASLIGIIGSLLCPKLLSKLTENKEPEIHFESEKASTDESLEEMRKKQTEEFKKRQVFRNQVVLTLVSLAFALVGQAFMIGANEIFNDRRLPHINVGCFFVAGMSIIMLGYNGMASTFPSMFSEYVKPEVKVQLMPIIGAMTAGCLSQSLWV
ncbi:hypothetical protein RJF_1873 [Candidozyma auris]